MTELETWLTKVASNVEESRTNEPGSIPQSRTNEPEVPELEPAPTEPSRLDVFSEKLAFAEELGRELAHSHPSLLTEAENEMDTIVDAVSSLPDEEAVKIAQIFSEGSEEEKVAALQGLKNVGGKALDFAADNKALSGAAGGAAVGSAGGAVAGGEGNRLTGALAGGALGAAGGAAAGKAADNIGWSNALHKAKARDAAAEAAQRGREQAARADYTQQFNEQQGLLGKAKAVLTRQPQLPMDPSKIDPERVKLGQDKNAGVVKGISGAFKGLKSFGDKAWDSFASKKQFSPNTAGRMSQELKDLDDVTNSAKGFYNRNPTLVRTGIGAAGGSMLAGEGRRTEGAMGGALMAQLPKLAQSFEKNAMCDSDWVKDFEGSPLLPQAISLAQEEIQLDGEPDEYDQIRDAREEKRRQLRTKKRMLELQLVAHRNGLQEPAPEEQAPAPEAQEVQDPSLEAVKQAAAALARTKTARVFGADVPDAAVDPDVSDDIRVRTFRNYLNQKSQESPTPYPTAMGSGAGVGAALGGLSGLGTGGGLKAVGLGGLVGAGFGAAGGALASKLDRDQIDSAKTFQGYSDQGLADETSRRMVEKKKRQQSAQEMMAERRHQEQLQAMNKKAVASRKNASLPSRPLRG